MVEFRAQPAADCSTWMHMPIGFLGHAFGNGGGHHKRVAKRHAVQGRAGTSVLNRTCLFARPMRKRQVAGLGHAGLQVANDGNRFRANGPHAWEQAQDFFSFTAIGNKDDQVVPAHRAQVAMRCFAGVQEKGRAGQAGKVGS